MQTNLSELRTTGRAFAPECWVADTLCRNTPLRNATQQRRATAFYTSVIAFILLTDVAVLLDIPFIRPLMGFACLTILPGALVLRVLGLDSRIHLEGRIALSTGLSISFSMLMGLFVNWSYPLLGYSSPLSTVPMIVTLTIALIALTSIAYLRDIKEITKDGTNESTNEGNTSEFNFGLRIGAREKTFLIISSAFPTMSILGTQLMNATGNNDVLMALLFTVPAYLILISLVRDKISEDFYPLAILFISISLVLLLGLRSNHLIGSDIHSEYYLFETAFRRGMWYQAFANDQVYGPLDACLSISILPSVYQSLMKVNPEFLFKTLYPLVFSVSPLVVYSLSRRYIDQFYSFLASMFFMSQLVFLITAYNPRTVTAILFFALLVMVTMDNRIRGTAKKAMFLVFSFSCILSHYTTTYIVLFTLTAWFCLKTAFDSLGSHRIILGIVNLHIEPEEGETEERPLVTLRTLMLLYAMTFFWYGQVTGAAFSAGVIFIYTSLRDLNNFFIIGARGDGLDTAFGVGILSSPLPQKISFISSWLTVALLCLGIMACVARYCLSGASIGIGIRDIMIREFDRDYFLISLVALGVLIASVALPQVGKGYGMDRVYFQMMVVLSPFFILGSKVVTDLLHAWNIHLISVHMIVLAVLIPYFLCNSGAMYEVFGMHKAVTLSSSGQMYDAAYIHDQETYGAKWLKSRSKDVLDVYSDFYGTSRLMSQGGIPSAIYPEDFIEEGKHTGDGYFYIRYYGAVYGKLMDSRYLWHNLTGYASGFGSRDLIYSNGGSEVYL